MSREVRMLILVLVIALVGISSWALADVAPNPCQAARRQLNSYARNAVRKQVTRVIQTQIKNAYAKKQIPLDTHQIVIRSHSEIKNNSIQIKMADVLVGTGSNVRHFLPRGSAALGGSVEYFGHQVFSTLGEPIAWRCGIAVKSSVGSLILQSKGLKIGPVGGIQPIHKELDFPIVN